MQKFKTIYDFKTRLLINELVLFILVVAMIILIGYYIYKLITKPEQITIMNSSDGCVMYFVAMFFSIVMIVVIISKTAEIIKIQNAYKNKELKITEGYVSNYHPMPVGGHGHESFDINGIHFFFSDFDESHFGYNNTASNGGAIKEGLHVKINYIYENVAAGNVILKLEIDSQ